MPVRPPASDHGGCPYETGARVLVLDYWSGSPASQGWGTSARTFSHTRLQSKRRNRLEPRRCVNRLQQRVWRCGRRSLGDFPGMVSPSTGQGPPDCRPVELGGLYDPTTEWPTARRLCRTPGTAASHWSVRAPVAVPNSTQTVTAAGYLRSWLPSSQITTGTFTGTPIKNG